MSAADGGMAASATMAGSAGRGQVAPGQLEREARRILRRLGVTRSHLHRLEDGSFAVARNREAASVSRIRVAACFVLDFAARGWIAADGPGRFVIVEAGRGWLARRLAEEAGEDSFAGQHRLAETRLVVTADGREQTARINAAESPLARLKFRGLVDPLQFEAGERLRRDFTLAQLTPRLGVDWSQPVSGSGRSGREELCDTVIAAKQRVNRALAAMGPGLGDLLFDVCCHLIALEAAESERGWSKRSARVVLKIALDRLAVHYGMGAVRSGRLRAWKMEEAPLDQVPA